MFGKTINKIVLASVGFICNDHNVFSFAECLNVCTDIFYTWLVYYIIIFGLHYVGGHWHKLLNGGKHNTT
ncbi:MAG: hypothetical protein FMNOHCHN_03815 [Ignavibacteriaceae bacterium]|nr:hypothetical protein [Ignavibacteriaceae bacterium]